MEKIEQRYSTRNLIVALAIAELFSSVTLWLVESPIKYPLFIIETLTIITIYFVLNNHDFEFALKKIPIRRISPDIFLDVILIYFASVLIVFNQFNITENTARFVLAFVCTSGLSGYALLNIFGLTKYFSKLEMLVLSFLASFILSGICTLLFLWTDETIRAFVIPSILVLIGIISFIKHLKSKPTHKEEPNSLARNIDILPIVLCVAFYAIFFYYMYPNFTLLIDSDISRHYSESIILSRTPDLYPPGLGYLLFHAFSSTLNILSGIHSMTYFLSILPILNIILPISVYIFTKRFFVNMDRRIPAIATVFFTMFSNFSFILFIKLKMLGFNGTEIGLLTNVADKAYAGSINFIQPFGWFVPLSVSTIMFIFAFLLLKDGGIPRSRFIPLFTVLIIAMYFTHVTEAVIFIGMLGVYSLVSKNKSLRLDDALLSSLIAFICTTIILSYISIFWTSPLRVPGINLSFMLPAVLSTLLLCICIFWRRVILHKIFLSMKYVSNKKFYYVMSTVLASFYLFGFLMWYFNSDSSTSLAYTTGFVPWFIYPLSLGLVGLLALVALRYFDNNSSNNSLLFFGGLIIIVILMGRTISFVNSNFQFTGYWEKRFLSYIFLFAAPLATLPIIKLMDHIYVKRKSFTNVFSATIISLIVLLGFSSMILQFDYWFYTTNSNTISQEEFQATTYLKNILQKDSHAIVVAPSATSENILTFAVPPYQPSYPEVLAYAEKPEIALFELSSHGFPHAYIYMHSRDFDLLKGKENWVIDHLLPTTPVIFSNGAVTIYNVTHVSYPRSSSDNHMLVPTDPSITTNSLFYAYDVISKHDSNYTVMFDRDQNALSAKTIVLSYDPPENKGKLNLRESSDYLSYVKSGGNLIVLNTQGYGSIYSALSNTGNSSYNSNKIAMNSDNSLPVNISVQPISAVKNIISIDSHTSSENKSSILIVSAFVGSGKITYVDIYPIIASFNDNKIDTITLNTIFDKISNLINLDTINTNSQDINLKTKLKMNFKEMTGDGNVTIKSSSLVFPYDQFTNVTVRNNDKEILMENVTKLNIKGYRYAIVHANHISIAKGNGLYGNVNLGDSLEISFKNNATLTALSDNNKLSRFDNVSNILIQNSEPIQTYLWQPEVHINGHSNFTQLEGNYGTGDHVISRKDLYLQGSVFFGMFMSDTYTYAINSSYTSSSIMPVSDLAEQVHQLFNMTKLEH